MNRLNKHIAILILSLPLLLIGCTILDEETPIGGESGKSYLEVNVEGLLTRGDADGITPTVNSIRVLVFGENGEFLGNRKVAISSSSIPLTLPTNVYGKKIYVYAVLNEDDSYCSTLESGVALSTELAKFTNNPGDRTAFLNLMNQPLKFDPANADASAEKIFLMYAKNEDVLVNSKATQDNPFPVNLSETEDVPRSMAKITIESINGDADADAAKVFVTDIRLENIPTSYSLSGENAGADTDLKFAEITMGDKSEYNNRGWDGIIATAYFGSAAESVQTDERCYLMSKDANYRNTTKNNRWLFEGTKRSYNKSGALVKGDCGESGSITTIIDNLDKLTSFKITKQSVSITRTNISFLKNSLWNLNIDESIYVPENNPQESKNATAIAITLMIKNPILNNVTNDKLASRANMGFYTYTVGKNDSSFPIKTDNNTVQTFFMNNANEEYDYWYGAYYWYLDNFKGSRTGSFDNVSFDSSMDGITTSWNDYKSYTFHIPVNNQNIDGDYSIKRNNHYQVSLKVTKATYDAIMKSGRVASGTQSRALPADQCPLEVSVKVSPLQ